MHEMSIAESILTIVEEQAAKENSRRVARFDLEIGQLASVEVESLKFCMDIVLKGSVAEGAQVTYHQPAGAGWCFACAEQVPMSSRFDACPRCGGFQLQPNAGTELRVKELWVA